ncbi:hypothetical protein ACFS07_06450 [Undibacterium arcticum]
MENVEIVDTAAGNRLLHFEDCQSAIDQLFAESLATNGVDGFHEFLEFVVRFNNLSIYNAMLVRVQRPGSGAVASRRKWKKYRTTRQVRCYTYSDSPSFRTSVVPV